MMDDFDYTEEEKFPTHVKLTRAQDALDISLKRVSLVLFGVVLFIIGICWLTSCSPPPLVEQYGSCFGVKPICMYPQRAVCMCQNYGSNCFWVCM